MLALALKKNSDTVAAIIRSSGLPHQVVVASLARLMRFRLVEISTSGGDAAFAASPIGASLALSGNPLPHFPQEILQRFSFGVEHVTGSCFVVYDARVVSQGSLEDDMRQGADVRFLTAEAGACGIAEASIARLYELIERGGDRRLLRLATRETVVLRNRYMRLRVTNGAIRHFPEGANESLRRAVLEIAGISGSVPVNPVSARPEPQARVGHIPVRCNFDPADIVIGGKAQSSLLTSIVEKAHFRLVIHSTFLDAERFQEMADLLRDAVVRGVTIDMLWGAGETADNHARNAAHAEKISDIVKADPTMRGRVKMHMRTTGSHAKILLADSEGGSWVAVVSSCNWLSTKFGPAELSVVLRNPLAVADAIELVRGLVGRRPLADGLADELRIQSNDLRRHGRDTPVDAGKALVTLIAGEAHDAAMRVASRQVTRRLVLGSAMLGSTAWTGTLMPGEVAAERDGVSVTMLYTRLTGPMKKRHAKALEQEVSSLGIRLISTDKVPLHGKFVLWDDDDVIVTSLNWASASSDDEFPASEIGVHVKCPGLANSVMERLVQVFPELLPSEASVRGEGCAL
nr:phosphatidylserine synthase [uncultured Rhodopila sp.]